MKVLLMELCPNGALYWQQVPRLTFSNILGVPVARVPRMFQRGFCGPPDRLAPKWLLGGQSVNICTNAIQRSDIYISTLLDSPPMSLIMDRICNGNSRVSCPQLLAPSGWVLTARSIYKELGPGERISLARLSVQHIESTNRPFRLAIDISIWQFQIQSGQGGRNPALRTLYYRILRLLSLGIRPLSVFDGPYKPKIKRNNKVSPNAASLDNYAIKQLFNRLGLPYHEAPGEAEAECALFQKEGIVDAVLSEDVDTIMFGCTLSLRNWTPEGARGAKTPTHVNIYTTKSNEKSAGLNSFGMILVALMSGGDYNTEGLPRCGPKIACEAARAGFGREMCELAKDDVKGWAEWRARLQHELHTNESRFFKRKHKSIIVPANFPDPTVLGYYRQPAISSPERVKSLRDSINWETDIDIRSLRDFVAEAFEWTYLIGAKHFIRSFAPALLAHRLLERNKADDLIGDDLKAKASAEARLITAIHGRRTHWNTDGSPGLRVSYVPANLVGLDLNQEEDIEQANDVVNSLEADDRESRAEDNDRSASPSKRRGPLKYDPNQFEKIWIPETFAKLGVPLLVENWEEEMRNPKILATRKAREKSTLLKATNGIRPGGMDQFVHITKSLPKDPTKYAAAPENESQNDAHVCSADAISASNMHLKALRENRRTDSSDHAKAPTAAKDTQPRRIRRPTGRVAAPKKPAGAMSPTTSASNPWTLSKRPVDTFGFNSPTRYSALGIYAPNDLESFEPRLRRSARPASAITVGEVNVSFAQQSTTQVQSEHQRIASSPDAGESSDNVTLSTPRRRGTSKPSPKKKRSPDLIRPNSATEVRRDVSHNNDQIIDPDAEHEDGDLASLTTSRANRRLKYIDTPIVAHAPPPPSPGSETSSFPSPSALMSSRVNVNTDTNHPALHPGVSALPPISHVLNHKEGARLHISLRESLEGSWKHIEPWQADKAKNVFTGVEFVDLTS